MAPALGASRSAITPNSGVFPQPDGPIKATNSPRRMVRLILSSATTGVSAGWNVIESPWISMAAGELPAAAAGVGEDAADGAPCEASVARPASMAGTVREALIYSHVRDR